MLKLVLQSGRLLIRCSPLDFILISLLSDLSPQRILYVGCIARCVDMSHIYTLEDTMTESHNVTISPGGVESCGLNGTLKCIAC